MIDSWAKKSVGQLTIRILLFLGEVVYFEQVHVLPFPCMKSNPFISVDIRWCLSVMNFLQINYFPISVAVFATWLVVVTFLHHADVNVPWYSKDKWDNVRGLSITVLSLINTPYTCEIIRGWYMELK